MKIFLVIVHVLIGLIFFFSSHSLVDIYQKVQNPAGFYPDYSVTSIVVSRIFGTVLGLISIVAAIAFRKDKRWAMVALPAVTAIITVWMFFSSMIAANKAEEGFLAIANALGMLFAIVPFILFIVEVVYMIFRFRKLRKQSLVN